MTTQTQVALSHKRTSEEYRDILGSNLEELERINKTINDTLYLAKAENSLLYQDKVLLDLESETSLPFIFDRFYRGDCSRENDCGIGAGLGLVITKSIIETYDGTITAHSEAGDTRFEIRFPLSDPT